ncbi:MAG TPA: alpha/beta hydrolase, partial [Pyrinomonadaceae bacterium]|nr:alpha/beta hydrolase [Pyrinomonadaceae bacterium]
YEGTLSADGTEISGQLKQGPATYPVTFKKTDKVPTLSRPQDPQKPYPYVDEEVSYENKVDAVKLAGTLTLPKGPGPFPAVVLITGSGAQDRNETIAGHRPFMVLADHLTRLGIAVLRVDDRGMGGSGLGSATATTENYAGDVLAGVEFLKNRKEIHPGKIGLIGHSEGGIIAPMAAIRSKDVSFIVLMAGTGLPGDEVIELQTDLLLQAQGTGEEGRKLTRDLFREIFAILKGKDDSVTAEKRIRDTVAAQTAAMTDAQRKGMDPMLKLIDTQLQQFYLSNWFRFFLRFDPRPTLRKVQIPVLAITGERDLQVAPKANLDAITAALKEGGNKDHSVVLLPQLNHLFQTSRTGLITEYGTIEETISPIALKTMSDWILKHTPPK